MKILVIGGTGTIGRPLVELLIQDSGNDVFYISRSGGGINRATHLVGNALDNSFMKQVLCLEDGKYDCIIDFMWYTESTFLSFYDKLLNATKHYIGMSSGAVYADSDQPMTEDMPRVIDICSKKERKRSQEYHMEKARIEDILKTSKYKNWTLIRPHVTFNSNRLPLFVWEKEQWLYRVLQGHTIVLTKDMLDKQTVLTYGMDVANAIIKLIGNNDAYGEIINITSDQIITRGELIAAYQKIIKEVCNIDMKILYLDSIEYLRKNFPDKRDRMDKDRMLNRTYDSSKLIKIVGDNISFSDFYDSLYVCCRDCILNTNIDLLKYNNGLFCAYMDRISNEETSLEYFDYKNKVIYFLAMRVPSYELFSNLIYMIRKLKSYIIKSILNN